ncbi:MAG: DinB family protein [Pseudomonadota bacterium]
MISTDHVRAMAHYNRWQNHSLYGAASTLSDDERRRDCGAFFKSIHGTLTHILWADQLWFSRFTDHPPPAVGGIPGSDAMIEDWTALGAARAEMDDKIEAWAAHMEEASLADDLAWYSGAMGREISKPRWLLVTHFFNHQTHHRGQVHALLTAAGARPDDTDLPFMPDDWARDA